MSLTGKCDASCFYAFVDELNSGRRPEATYKGEIPNDFIFTIRSETLERLVLISLNKHKPYPRVDIDCPRLKYLNIDGVNTVLFRFANNCAAKTKLGWVKRCQVLLNGKMVCKALL